MSYKYFFNDYYEGKEIPSSESVNADKSQILHSMDCVLHMPDNFLGIFNSEDQCLQFMVTKEGAVTIDIPILKDGSYVGSKSKTTSLSECLALVEGLTGDEDFENVLTDETLADDQATEKDSKKPWWKFWLETLITDHPPKLATANPASLKPCEDSKRLQPWPNSVRHKTFLRWQKTTAKAKFSSLQNVVEMAKQHPDSFFIPSQEERAS